MPDVQLETSKPEPVKPTSLRHYLENEPPELDPVLVGLFDRGQGDHRGGGVKEVRNRYFPKTPPRDGTGTHRLVRDSSLRRGRFSCGARWSVRAVLEECEY